MEKEEKLNQREEYIKYYQPRKAARISRNCGKAALKGCIPVRDLH